MTKYSQNSTINSIAAASFLNQIKFDNILSSHSMLPVQRDSINISSQSTGTSSISSSKKHREFMRAQELSKVLVTTTNVVKPTIRNNNPTLGKLRSLSREPSNLENEDPIVHLDGIILSK